MNIALIAHDKKKELMVQFCIAYSGILSKHSLYATGTTGKMIIENTGLNVYRFCQDRRAVISKSVRELHIMKLTWCFSFVIRLMPKGMSLTYFLF